MKNVLIFAAALWQSGWQWWSQCQLFPFKCHALSQAVRAPVCVCAELIFSSCKVPKCESAPPLIPFTILPLNHPSVPVFSSSPLLLPPPPYPLVVHKDSALSCQMKLPKPGSHHLDNHFLLFAFYVDLIIFHLRRDGNHKLHCVPHAFAQIKRAARIIESANGGKI